MASAPNIEPTVREQILDLSRQNNIGPLSPYLSATLDRAIEDGYYPDFVGLRTINDAIIERTRQYREQTGITDVVLGMSGGVDSALCAAIFKAAGYRVIGVTMPIHQVQAETDRGVEAINAIGIEHLHMDLTVLYNATLGEFAGGEDPIDIAVGEISDPSDPSDPEAFSVRVRRGNIRARLRMITLYNLASLYGGMVASTDNLSELGAGFWTLHGDVGDFSPIQSLLKSWEVPYLARLNGVPESTVRAKPTDGLGIHEGDEAQLGCSYLEWDLMTYAISVGYTDSPAISEETRAMVESFLADPRAKVVYDAVVGRMGATWYKRKNPLNVPHPLEDRYALLDSIDRLMFVPECFKDA